MEQAAKRVASKIAYSLNYDNEKEEIITYGLIGVFQIFINILIVIILGLLLKVCIEALIITFSVVLLRKYSGGVHAKSLETCIAISVFYSITFGVLSKYIISPIINHNIIINVLIIIIVYLLSFIIIYLRAPVDSPNKPIKSEKKIKRMRKNSFIILYLYLIISIIILFIPTNKIDIISYGISLLFGILWQIMTLTKFGYYFINKQIIAKEVNNDEKNK